MSDRSMNETATAADEGVGKLYIRPETDQVTVSRPDTVLGLELSMQSSL